MRIVAIVQTRMGSTRLQKKVLMTAVGKTFIELLMERIKHSKYIQEVIIATTTNPRDDVLFNFCTEKKFLFSDAQKMMCSIGTTKLQKLSMLI